MQPLQQRKAVLPGASSTFTGTPMEPNAFSVIGQFCWAIAAARSAGESLSRFLTSSGVGFARIVVEGMSASGSFAGFLSDGFSAGFSLGFGVRGTIVDGA